MKIAQNFRAFAFVRVRVGRAVGQDVSRINRNREIQIGGRLIEFVDRFVNLGFGIGCGEKR